MRTKLLITVMLTIGIIFTCYSSKGHYNDLVCSNVQALTDDEWGGGHQIPGGGVEWYEYEQYDYFYKYCRPIENSPIVWCSCFSQTCHGYGDMLCYGILRCSEASPNDPSNPDFQ